MSKPAFDRSPEVRLSVCPVWLTEHAHENNTMVYIHVYDL